MTSGLPLPARPVPVEQPGDHPCLNLAGLVGLQMLRITVVISSALGVDFAGYDNKHSVGRQNQSRKPRWISASPAMRRSHPGSCSRSAMPRPMFPYRRCACHRATNADDPPDRRSCEARRRPKARSRHCGRSYFPRYRARKQRMPRSFHPARVADRQCVGSRGARRYQMAFSERGATTKRERGQATPICAYS